MEDIWREMPAKQNRLKDFPAFNEKFFLNELGLPVGQPIEDWKTPDALSRGEIHGKRCAIQQLGLCHASDLWETFSADSAGKMWRYKSYGPFPDLAILEKWIELIKKESTVFAIKDLVTGRCIGTIGLVSDNPSFGSIQFGHLNVTDLDSDALTEAIGLLMKRIFDAG